MSGDDALNPFGESGNTAEISDKDKECREGQQQRVVHLAERMTIRDKNRKKYRKQHDRIWQDSNNSHQADGEECGIHQNPGTIHRMHSGILRQKGALTIAKIHFSAEKKNPCGKKQQRYQRIRQHQPKKCAHTHAAFPIEIQILRVADRSQHTAEISSDRLHTDDRDCQLAENFITKAVKYNKGKGNECDQRHVIRDQHTAEKTETDQDKKQSGCAFCPFQQNLSDMVEYILSLKSRHNRHQREQDSECAKINISRIERIRMDDESRENRQENGDDQNRLLTQFLFYFCMHYNKTSLVEIKSGG